MQCNDTHQWLSRIACPTAEAAGNAIRAAGLSKRGQPRAFAACKVGSGGIPSFPLLSSNGRGIPQNLPLVLGALRFFSDRDRVKPVVSIRTCVTGVV